MMPCDSSPDRSVSGKSAASASWSDWLWSSGDLDEAGAADADDSSGYLSSWYDWWYSEGSGGSGPVNNYIEEVKNSQGDSGKTGALKQVHPDETPELIMKGYKELEDELAKFSEVERSGWEEAKRRCPELVGREHQLMFLRCEVFGADRAAKRLVRYWSKRIEIFGPSRAFLPLTLSAALKDDFVALSLGFMSSTERADSENRRIIYGDPAKLNSSLYERESMVRALWYTVHAALEDETTQRRGAVLMLNHRDVAPSQFDPELVRLCAESLRGCIPLRIGAIHLFHLPFFVNYIAPLFKYLLGERLWSRIAIHDGHDEEVLGRLEAHGIRREDVPGEIGGGHELNQTIWLAERTEAGL